MHTIGWYSGMLLTHANTILGNASSIFRGYNNVNIAGAPLGLAAFLPETKRQFVFSTQTLLL